MDESDLTFALEGTRQQFRQQIDFFRAKLNLPTERWDDIKTAAHDRAFMVAGAQKADLLNDLRQAVDKSISGQSIGEFRKDFAAAVKKSGWSGWTGQGTKDGEAWRTRVSYQTNVATSYAAGRWQQLNDPDLKAVRPFWQYIHADGVVHPRPMHKAWGDSGLTLPADHPFWLTHFPPNGWGCGCRVKAVRLPRGTDATSPPDGWDAINEKTGAPAGIDKGWGYAPGASMPLVLQQKMAALPDQLAYELAASIDLKKMFDSAPGGPSKVAMAKLSDADRNTFNTTANDLWLSKTTLAEHQKRHPEIGLDDYLHISKILREGQIWEEAEGRRFALLLIANRPYRASVKTDASGQELWLLSLIENRRQKPPKGAVRVR